VSILKEGPVASDNGAATYLLFLGEEGRMIYFHSPGAESGRF